MKKYLLMISFFVCALVLNISSVKAEVVTIEQVINNWGENLKDAYKNFAGAAIDELNAKYFAEITNNEIVVKQSINDEIQKLAELKFENDIISHEFVYNGQDISVEMLKNSYLYSSLLVTIGRLHGYSNNDLETAFSEISTAKFDANGYELTANTQNDVRTSSFRVDINKFNLEGILENGESSSNNPINDNLDNSNIDNPKTGIFNPTFICVLIGVNCILFMYVLNKKNKIEKI